ncbi:MAG: threonine/serine dehydratase [Propionibacteriales bacterium]|nr:threonine/serine dehydratase [Propionibacteriales bacterium]
MIDRSDVLAAADRIRGWVRTTPVLEIDTDLFGGSAFFKLELHQHTGTFKARGAFNRILRADADGELDRAIGIVVASGGNAGLANAFAAARLGVPATVFVPENAPAVKVASLRELGATVVLAGSEYAEAFAAAQDRVASTGALYCHAYDQPDIAAGAGTLALELQDQVPDGLDTVLVAVGGGGLMAGVAAALEGQTKVVGAEPVTAPTLTRALEAGRPVDVAVSGIAADSLGARRLGQIGFDVATRTRVEGVLVTDQDLREARAMLWSRWRIVVEYGAAAAWAALMSGSYRPAADERLGIVLCGANTDLSDLA